MNQIYFEAKGEALLERIGMTKAEFARRMGIRKQNVKALFKSKNLETIYKAAGVMGVPFEMLVGYIEEPDLSEIPLEPYEEEEKITEDGIPTGDTPEDVVAKMLEFTPGTRFMVLAPLQVPKGRTLKRQLEMEQQQGYSRLFVNNEVVNNS